MSRWDDPTRGFENDRGWETPRHDETGEAPGARSDDVVHREDGPATTSPHDAWEPPAASASPSPVVPGSMAPQTPAPAPRPAPIPTTGPDAARTSTSYPASPGVGPQDGPRHTGFTRIGPGGVPELWPGPIPLRPMAFGEMLETAFSVLRFNPRTIFGLSYLVIGAATLLSAAVSLPLFLWASTYADDVVGQLGPDSYTNSFNLFGGVGTALLAGILMAVIADTALGRRLTFRQAWDRTKGRIGALILFLVLEWLLFVALFLPLIGICTALVVADQWVALVVVAVFGGLATMGVYVWLSVAFCLAPPAIVLERVTAVQAFRRSFELVRGSWWRVFGIRFVTGLLVGLVGGIIMIPMAIAVTASFVNGTALGGSGTLTAATVIGLLAMAAASVLVSGLTQPYSSTMDALIYLDRRFRTEALAVDLLAEAERDVTGAPTTGLGPVR